MFYAMQEHFVRSLQYFLLLWCTNVLYIRFLSSIICSRYCDVSLSVFLRCFQMLHRFWVNLWMWISVSTLFKSSCCDKNDIFIAAFHIILHVCFEKGLLLWNMYPVLLFNHYIVRDVVTCNKGFNSLTPLLVLIIYWTFWWHGGTWQWEAASKDTAVSRSVWNLFQQQFALSFAFIFYLLQSYSFIFVSSLFLMCKSESL